MFGLDVALGRLGGPLGGVVDEVIVDGIVKSVGHIGRKVSGVVFRRKDIFEIIQLLKAGEGEINYDVEDISF